MQMTARRKPHVELGGSSAPTRLGKTSRGSTDDKEIQGGRPCKLEFGGWTGQRENRQGAHEGRELQRIRPPRQQGRTPVRNQKRQDRSRCPAQGRRAEAPAALVDGPRTQWHSPSSPSVIQLG